VQPPFLATAGIANVAGFHIATSQAVLSQPLDVKAIIQEITIEDTSIPPAAHFETFFPIYVLASMIDQMQQRNGRLMSGLQGFSFLITARLRGLQVNGKKSCIS
jgi:hypothetical protein